MLPSVPQHSVSVAPGHPCSVPATALSMSVRTSSPEGTGCLVMAARANPMPARRNTTWFATPRSVPRRSGQLLRWASKVAFSKATHSVAALANSSRPVAEASDAKA